MRDAVRVRNNGAGHDEALGDRRRADARQFDLGALDLLIAHRNHRRTDFRRVGLGGVRRNLGLCTNPDDALQRGRQPRHERDDCGARRES